jgi:NAD(P)H-dependent FMN reductase
VESEEFVEAVEPPQRVAVVIGSTRPTRICPGIAAWVKDAAQQESSLRYELLDLAEVGLPFLDEPRIAARGHYEHEHTRAWSRTVAAYSAFVFVFPQWRQGCRAVPQRPRGRPHAAAGGSPGDQDHRRGRG